MSTKTKVTTPFLAIQAAIEPFRRIERTPEAIMAALGKATAAGAKVSKPTDGTVTTGRFTGLHIMEFQDRLYGHNMLRGWGYTDAALALAWKVEFPNAKCDFAVKNAYVTSARADLNRGARTGLKLAQLNAQYGFEGKVAQFHLPPIEEKAKVKRPAKAKKAEPTPEPTPEPVAAESTPEPVAAE